MDEWCIKIDRSYCKYVQNGLCFYRLKEYNKYNPPWCKKENCKIKI